MEKHNNNDELHNYSLSPRINGGQSIICARTGRTPRPVYSNAPRNSPFRNEYVAVDLGNLKDNNGHNERKKKQNKRIIIIISVYTVRRIIKRERRIDIR